MLKKKKFTKFAKRKDDKALVHEEYMSGDEDDGDDDQVGTTAISMYATTSSSCLVGLCVAILPPFCLDGKGGEVVGVGVLSVC